MTATPLPLAQELQDLRTAEIIAALDADFLSLVSWDWDVRVVRYPKIHPVLGMPDCEIPGCTKGTPLGEPVCIGCRNRWRQSGMSFEDFAAVPRPGTYHRSDGQTLCRVAGCQRPPQLVTHGLCTTHGSRWLTSSEPTVEDFLRNSPQKGLPGFGPCQVAACYRLRGSERTIYCEVHRGRLNRERRLGTFCGDEERWRLTTPAVAVNREASLRGLPDRLVAELLYCLQVRTAREVKTRDHRIRHISDQLRLLQVPSLETLEDADLVRAGLVDDLRMIIRGAQTSLRRLGATPETERLKDIWDLFVFGHHGTLNFSRIHQQPLREAVKIWAYDELPRRRGRNVAGSIQNMIRGMEQLSESLRLQRDDEGHQLRLLSRTDMVSFCNRVAFLAETGVFGAHHRVNVIRYVRNIVNRIRVMGLTGPGQVMEGLPTDFALSIQDIPDEPEDTEAGRDLPDEVMRELCDNLDLLEKISNREFRVATELLIDTGRRPDEISTLPFECLEKDPDGTLVLLYDNSKNYRLGRRLPIGQVTAAVITEQQERVRQRFPDTPASKLKLLPSPISNPQGTKPIGSIGDAHRAWVDALPDIMMPVVVEADGQLVTKMLPFDKSKIFPYAYRHSFAQRHADANIAPDVLMDLMDHREISTTQGYYRVSQERRREAVDRVTALQFDRRGNRVWRKAQAMLDSEHVRRAIGEVATAYGICLEPHNVAAGGQSCPLRFRCVGCDHFRTDVSYLPDLERYLSDLLRSRERLMSTFEADDWARSEALPSEEEIRRVRRLINRVKADLDDLSEEERAQIEEAVTVVRRGRVVMLGMPRVGQPLPDVRPWRLP
ncbi:tyrosine-type recombinase/integrase [Streptomyces sp. NPDC004237]|uniref:tyrosine-type recombinase/integrase n=1 Tax=Streptomyces sp. NPDC004237 TaxID=3154455 RepID=UPI0033A316F1